MSTLRLGYLLAGPNHFTHTFSIAPTVTLYNDLRIFAVAEGLYGRIGSEQQVHWGHRYNNSYCTQARFGDPACMDWNVRNTDGMFHDIWAQSAYRADFWKLREVGAQYQLPQSLVQRTGANRASLSLAARDLWVIWQRDEYISGRKIPDPEFHGGTTSGSTLWMLPGIASVTATFRVSF